ncbi:hypothetical protein [Paenibacillus nasutitermitis]|uniref:Uncharacterized protein n=1 Tax=Paenibacillus nasutitermitis TaxID=1652958 RepID=A0A916YZU6_9BACL|nr:hypothetical protein [Paenibacillus nasutitermitis]GGD69445.1 hypothetical protein GCM10010911_29190 [Paenibacillus nasutitermitis]
MEKRLTRTEMLFSLGFLFMLVCAVGAFFYGVKIGSDQTEAKLIEQTKHLSGGKTSLVPAYQQQDLVSFYHTVFLPYREFQNEWTQTLHKISTGQISDSASALKGLASTAKQKYKEANLASVPASSPLLEQSQLQLLKGLKLFGEAAQRGAGSAKDMSVEELVKELVKDAFYLEGVKQALTGQVSYYYAMMKWSSSVDPHIPDQFSTTSVLALGKWKTLPLVVKNKVIAEQLKSRMLIIPYYPQDLTSRVDQFISSGQASKMGMKTLGSVIDLLIDTEAVRSGDFDTSKPVLYAKELLPQLPFFFPE